jgi:hypothetical protein
VAPTLFCCVIAAVESLWEKTILTFGKPPRFIPETERERKSLIPVKPTSILPGVIDLIGLGSVWDP